jgi:hypothetical protein
MAQTVLFDEFIYEKPYFWANSSCVIFKIARSILAYSSLYANDLKVKSAQSAKLKQISLLPSILADEKQTQ